jgi:hypothetical protein
MGRFADRIAAEAEAQRGLRAEGRPIPPGSRRYARLAGLAMLLVCWSGALDIYLLGRVDGRFYYMFALFLVVFGLVGLAQVVTGRHLVSGSRRR